MDDDVGLGLLHRALQRWQVAHVAQDGVHAVGNAGPSNRLGWVGGASAKPVTVAPSCCSHSAFQLPLNQCAGQERRACPLTRRLDSLPELPWRFAAGHPQLFQEHFVAQGIHGLPRIPRAVGHQLTLGRQGFQRRAFPNGVVTFDEVEHLGGKNEKPAVDQATIPLVSA